MKILLFALLSLFALSSCVTQKRCLQKFPMSETRDSVYIEKIKEIPIYLPGDTINVIAPVNCPDQDIVSIENSKLKQQISILKGKFVSNTIIKPDTVKVFVPEIHTIIQEVKVPEPVKYIPKIYKNAMAICIFIFSGVLLWLGFKAYKIFRP